MARAKALQAAREAAYRKAEEARIAEEEKMAAHAAEVERKRKEKEAAEEAERLRLKAIADEIERQKEAEEAKRKAEEDRLKKEQEAAEKAAYEAEQAQIAALRAEANAKTQAEIEKAKAAAAAVAEKVAAARKERQRLLDEKRNLAIEAERLRLREAQTKRDLEEQNAKAARAKKARENAEARAKAAAALAAKEKARLAAEVAKAKAEAEAQQKAAQAAHDAAEKERAELAEAARIQDEKEHQEEMARRRKLDAEAAERHHKQMLERKAAFEKVFRNLWGRSATKVSQVSLLAKDLDTSKKIIHDAFADTLAADVFASGSIIRSTKPADEINKVVSALNVANDQVRVDLVTTDDRVAELIEVAVAAAGDDGMPVLVTPVAQASSDYLEWAKEQCVEMDQTDAHYNDDPFAKKRPTAHEKIMGMADFQKNNTATAAPKAAF